MGNVDIPVRIDSPATSFYCPRLGNQQTQSRRDLFRNGCPHKMGNRPLGNNACHPEFSAVGRDIKKADGIADISPTFVVEALQ